MAATLKGAAVVDVLVWLDNPDKLFAGMIEIELNFVGGGTDRFVTSELKLLNEVLMGVLCHAATLVGVEEDVVDIEGGCDKRLVVGGSDLDRTGASGACMAGSAAKVVHCPEAFINGAEVEVNLDLVILKSNEGESETRVAAVPELKGHVEGGLGQGVAGGTYLARAVSIARTVDV